MEQQNITWPPNSCVIHVGLGFTPNCCTHPSSYCFNSNAGDNNTDILSRIFAGISVFYNHTGSVACFEIEDKLDGIDGWNWQVGKMSFVFEN